MRPFVRPFAVLTTLLATLPLVAHADSFSYSFTDTTDAPNQIDFTYVSPTLITTNTTFTPLTCMVENLPCASVEFLFDPFGQVNTSEIRIESTGTPTVGIGDVFNSTAFLTTLGTNDAFNGKVTLTITDLSTTSPVPEPSTIALFGTGLLGLAGIIRRRFFRP